MIGELKMKKAVIYIRCSTDKQIDGYGLQAQEAACREYARKNGYEVVSVYREEGVSGAKLAYETRPVLFSVLQENNPPIEAVIVYAFDRISRHEDVAEFFSVKAEFGRKGMKLLSTRESEDTSAFGAFSTVIEAIILTMAAMEREKIKARTKSGKAEKAKQGGYVCGLPRFGYDIGISDNGEKKLVVNEGKAEIVKKVFEMKNNGKKFREISDAVNVPISTIQKILKNKDFYNGIYKYSDVITENHHESII